MRVLALDTATPATSVAVAGPDDVLFEATAVDPRRHAELLAPLLAQALRAAGPVDAVAAGLGPGPFTGLRVGLVTAAALADALGVPAHGECTLDVIGRAHVGETPLAVFTDARRREVYWAAYDERGRRVGGPGVDTPDVAVATVRELGARRVAGAGASLYASACTAGGLSVVEHDPYPSAALLAQQVARRVTAGGPGEPLRPMYLRRPDAVPPGAPKPVVPA